MLVVKYIEGAVETKFLGLQTDNHINWKNHTKQMTPTLKAACYAVMSTVHISNITTIKSIHNEYSSLYYKIWKIFGVTPPTVGRISLYKRTPSELWQVLNPEPLVEVNLNLEILHVPRQYMLSLMHFVINNQDFFKIRLYTILIQGIIIVFIDQMPT